ncbi:MAG: flippase [Geobacteraceae bacterium]|nr:flippase [Geobacteraceae bacterium]
MAVTTTIARNSLWLFLAEGSNKGILFVITIILARHFTVEEYGVFGFVFSIMTLIAMVADFGLANITLRELAKTRNEATRYFDDAIFLKIILSVTACLIMSVVGAFLPPGIRILAMLAGVAILLEGMTDYLRIAFRASDRSQFEAVIKAVTALILIGLVICAVLLRLSLVHVLMGYIVAYSLGLILAIRLLDRRIKISLNLAVVRPLFIESWPMFLGIICISAYGQIDLLLISAFCGFAEVGLYQAAYKLLFGFQLLRVIHMAMFPKLAALHADGDFAGYRSMMQRSILCSLVSLVPVGIITCFFPEEIVRLVFGQEYTSAASALPFLIWSGILSFVASYFSSALMIAGRQRIWLMMEFLVLVLLLVVEVILIPGIGFMGAAIATFVGEAVFLLIIFSWVAKDNKLRGLFFSGDQKEC